MDRQNIKDGDMVAFEYMGRKGVAVMREPDWFHVAVNIFKETGRVWMDDAMPAEAVLREPDFLEQLACQALLREAKTVIPSEVVTIEGERAVMPLLPFLRNEAMVRLEFPKFADADNNRLRHQMLVRFFPLIDRIRMHGCTKPYVLSEQYETEMCRQAPGFDKRGLTFEDLVGTGNIAGVLCVKRSNGKYNSILFRCDADDNYTMDLALLADDVLKFCVTVSRRKLQSGESSSGTLSSTFRDGGIIKLTMRVLYLFLCMEHAALEVVKETLKESTGTDKEPDLEGYMRSVQEEVHTDTIMRDATWFNTFWVEKAIPVRCYKQHKLKRDPVTGELRREIVEVSGYTKSGYHRKAKMLGDGRVD